MVALAASDVTLTIEAETIQVKQKRNRVKIVFGDGALTYPALGIPMPTFGEWGMRRNLDSVILSDSSDGDGFMYKYDQENNKIRMWQGDNNNASDAPGVELGVVAVAATTLYAEAVGW